MDGSTKKNQETTWVYTEHTPEELEALIWKIREFGVEEPNKRAVESLINFVVDLARRGQLLNDAQKEDFCAFHEDRMEERRKRRLSN